MSQKTNTIPVLSRRERQILDVLFRRREATALEIQAELADAPSYSTVRALLRILEDKDKWIKRQAGSFDRVLVDAPCSGTGAWRRNPDARWHLKPENLESLRVTQEGVLEQGAGLVKLGGRLIYATCSLLPEENAGRVETFLASHPGFKPLPIAGIWAEVSTAPCPTSENFLTLTPARNGTDGFFVAVLERIS